MSEAPPAHRLYNLYLKDPEKYRVAERLWGEIPRNLAEAVALMVRTRASYDASPPRLEDLKKVLSKRMRGMGVLTEKAAANIERLGSGVAETGQQPNLLAGSSLIFNKTVYTAALAAEGGLTPVYFVGDYDGVQPELINGRLPSPGGRGIVITYPVPEGYENAPIRSLPVPSEQWLGKTLEKIESNVSGLFRGVEPDKQERVRLNLEHAFTIIRSAYHSSENVAEWSSRILGTIFNLEADLGVVFFTPSDLRVRTLMQDGFERLLAEPNRSRFIEASNGAADLIEANGFRVQIGKRGRDYVPFFFECREPRCHGGRVELKYSTEGSSAVLRGRCPRCEESYSFSVDAANPDISEFALFISPRVDSRQAAVNSVLPVCAHVGGPGETSYHAEVMPGIKATGAPFPAYVRYARVFYNTPWNEHLSKELVGKGYPILTRAELFAALSHWVDANRRGDKDGLAVAHSEIEAAIDGAYLGLTDSEEELNKKIDSIKKKLGDPETRQALLAEMKELQRDSGLVDTYMSSAFGRFEREKYGQEVGWLWLDLASVTGIGDLLGVYKRLYGPWTPNSSTFFVNLS